MKKQIMMLFLLLSVATMYAKNAPIERDTIFTLKVVYLYAANHAQAAESYAGQFAPGASYSIPSPEITGYVADPLKVEGVMPDHDVLDTVLYTPKQFRISLKSEPQEGGQTSGGGTHDYGSLITVTAEAAEGYSFVVWKDNDTLVSTDAAYTFTVQGDRVMTAFFEEVITTHNVLVNQEIVHGIVTVTPSNDVEPGTQVSITAIPDDYYSLQSLEAYNKDDALQTVTITDNKFTMPDFDVMVTATFSLDLPTIGGEIEAPAAICAGETLTLTAPSVVNADEVAWQMAATAEFINPITYEGQSLDGTYNGWKLRLMASNASGVVYSNVVEIVINDLSNLTLTGESSLCSGIETQYKVVATNDLTLEWTTTDDNAIIVPEGNTAKIMWATAGDMTLTVVIEDPQTGCTAELQMGVKVQSFIDESDVQNIVAKKQNGKPYMLIYPNPKDEYKYQWYKDGEAIEGADKQYYYPVTGLAAGHYQVYISFNADAEGNLFCGAFSPVFEVADAAYVVFPNPASANEPIVVLTDSDAETTITIYNMEGQLVHRQMSQGSQTTIDVTLAQGVYVIRLANDSIEKMEKIIIK